jgi:hypothetical protein
MATTPRKTAAGPPTSSKPAIADPYNLNSRILRQVSELLKQLEEGEHVTLKERFQALAAIARIQIIFVNLRKEKIDDEPERGTAVRKYAGAFKAHDSGRGAEAAGRAAASDALDDNWFESADRDDDFTA